MIYKPHVYQQTAYNFINDNDFCALFLDMGLGKTVVTLTILNDFLESLTILKPLIVAPKFVCEATWPAEIMKWDHTELLSTSIIAGTPAKRLKALSRSADIFVVGRDNLPWLVAQYAAADKVWPFDMLILDESSSFKNHKSKRYKAIMTIRPLVDRIVELTGTPAPNGLIDIWAQMKILDNGKRLGKFIGTFRDNYFRAIPRGEHINSYELKPGKDQLIYKAIGDVCLSMKASDWLDVPELKNITVEVELDDYTEFKEFRKEKILETPEKRITAFNSSALYNKLLQYANGAVYDDEHNYHIVHNNKLEALADKIEELQGRPVLIFYQFQSDVDRILKRVKDSKKFTGTKDIALWNRGELPILLVHEDSIGYGLNMQDGGNYLFWYGVTDNMAAYWQAVKRVHRQGQKHKVFNYHFTTKGTPEAKVYAALQGKTLTQDELFEALK